MPAPKKELPPGECGLVKLSITVTSVDQIDFEISSETGKVRCQTCLAASGHESWILRKSAHSHLKSEHHRECEIAKKRHDETEERLRRNFQHDAEQSAAMWDEFLTPGAIPSIQVNVRETVAPARPTLTEEDHGQAEWLRDFVNQTEDASRSGTDGRDRSLDEWLATTFGEALLLEHDEDETVPNVLNTACLSIH